MATRMQQRRGTAAQWISTNSGNGPVLNPGEIGWESDTNKFKIGDGVNHWINLSYFVDLNTTIAGAPGLLNSLDELAAAIGDDPAFFTTVATNLTNHQNDTTAIHGIADTSLLVTTTGTQTLTNKTLTSPAISTPTGITKSDVGLSNVDNTTDANKPVSTATQTALDLKSPLASPTFTGTVVLPAVSATGHIIPSTDNTYDLGSPTHMFKDIYVGPGSLYVNGQKVLQDISGAIVVSADLDENLGLRTSGAGNIELDPTGTGNINIKGPLVMQAATNISSADGNAVTFGGAINTDTISSKTANTDLSITANGTGKVYLNDNAEVSGNLVVGGNLTISGTTTSVNTETISLADNIIDLNSNFTTGTPTENAGLRIMRGDSNSVQVRWNESTDKWEFTTDGTNYSVIAGLDSPTFTGTVSGVTKAHVGLDNVDNTTDALKPVSTATQTALDLKASTSDLSTHASDTTNVHGIADTNELATKEYVTTAVGNATIDQTGQGGVGITWNTVTEAFDIDNTVATLTGAQTLTDKTLTSPVINAPTGITKSDVGLANVDNTTDANKPVSTATQTALDLKLASATAASTYAPLASPTFTGTVTLPANTISQSMMGDDSVGTNEIGGLAVTTGKLADEAVTNAKVSATAAIAQSKIADLTTDLAAKAPLAAPAFTGDATAVNLTVSGNLTVDGTTTNINSTNLVVEDKNVVLGDTATPTDTTANGGGITLKGETDKTFNWVNATDAWTSSEHINLASGKTLKYNGTDLVAAQSISTTLNAATAFPSGASNHLYLNVNDLIEIQSSAGMAAQDATAFNNAFPVGTSVTINGTIGAPGTAVFTVTGAAYAVSGSILANITLTTGNGVIIYDNDWVMTATVSQAGKYLTTNGTSTSWATVSGYSAPTLGSTSIASGATVTTVAGLTKITSAAHVSLDASGYEQDIVLMNIMGAY